ncbi:UbiA prenyltransferase family [Diaporthe sp. PMI_573]|nr:UbiA prenyltransferase family [Diaporthaceae sp. PMI_573]
MFVLEQAYWTAVPSIAYNAAYHAQTLWLFTFSDLKTIAIPSTVAGISNAVAAPLYGIATAHHPLHVIWRAPLVFLWVWMNLLPFDINNQRTPPAISEDSINKPWRPIPQRRLSPVQAKAAMLCLYVVAQLVSLKVEGGLRQGIVLVLLGTWYNNFGGADSHPIIRNMINALGYLCFISGAMEVALGGPIPLSASGPQSRLLWWFGVLGGMILTTVHAQDMSDQEGDALRGRRTIPLVIGDGPARWTIATSMMVWGLLCPAMWRGSALSWVLTVGLSILVGARTLARRSVSSDKRTFVIWNIWVSTLYILPLL